MFAFRQEFNFKLNSCYVVYFSQNALAYSRMSETVWYKVLGPLLRLGGLEDFYQSHGFSLLPSETEVAIFSCFGIFSCPKFHLFLWGLISLYQMCGFKINWTCKDGNWHPEVPSKTLSENEKNQNKMCRRKNLLGQKYIRASRNFSLNEAKFQRNIKLAHLKPTATWLGLFNKFLISNFAQAVLKAQSFEELRKINMS